MKIAQIISLTWVSILALGVSCSSDNENETATGASGSAGGAGGSTGADGSAGAGGSSNEGIWLDDAFADSEHRTQSLPQSAAWWTSAAADSLTVVDQALAFPGDTGAPQHIVAYFTPPGSAPVLSPGDTLTASFHFTVTKPVDATNGWRIGLFNSGGDRVTADAQTASHPSYSAWTGYAAMLNPGGATGAQLWKRSGKDEAMIASLTPFTALGSPVSSQAFSPGVTYTAVLAVKRTASEVDLALTFSGGALSKYVVSASDTSAAVTSFDALGMSINRTGETPSLGMLTLDDVRVELQPGEAPPPDAPVLTAYEMLGNPMFSSTQGDLSESRATKYTFTVMKTGRLNQIVLSTQGARSNSEWGDTHALGSSGSYHVRVYSPAADGSVGGTAANPGGAMTLLGGTKQKWYPGQLVNSFHAPENLWPSKQNQTIGPSIDEYVGGAKVQSFIVRSRASVDAHPGDADQPPAGFVGSTRASATSILFVDIYDKGGEYGIPVAQGQVLCISQENQDPDPTKNYAHNNEAHSPFAPIPEYGVATPLDPAAGVYYNAGNRDWRKMPHFGVQIDGSWFGQPFYFRDGTNQTDENPDADGAARLLYDDRYARQVITPHAGYSRTMRKLWVHAVRYTGKAGYTDAAGKLQVRILRAPVGSTTWTPYWPESGWSTFAAGTFGAHATVIAGGDSPASSGKLTSQSDLAKLVTYGEMDLSPSLVFAGTHHYAIEVRVDPSTPKSAFYMEAAFNPYYIYNRDRPPGRPVINYSTILPYGKSGQEYNRAETSNNAGASWGAFVKDVRMFPIALEPESQ